MNITNLLAGVAIGAVVTTIAGVAYALSRAGEPVAGPAPGAAGPVFPTVRGENLNKRPFELPAGFDAPYSVVMVAFYQRQQEDVNTWLPTAAELAKDHANVEYYELPTISAQWGLVRGWVDGGMRSGIPAFAARERTITLYTDTAEFRRIAGIDDPERIWVGLVDRAGVIHWSARGTMNADSERGLRTAVGDLAAPQSKGL
ncbi:MAG: hypothetical protein C0475_03040 [Planctomyces sp.]|nr:hypothetical protein [Planctomyces sp.]